MSGTGLEFNLNDARFVREELGFEVYTEPIEKTPLPEAHFDVITAYDVLEHVDDPVSFLTALRKYLKPEGHICIQVPNIQDVLLSVYDIPAFGDFWFREVHLFNYSPKTLNMMLEKCGFKGTVQSVENYNILNHLNWLFTGEPQASMEVGMSQPVLVQNPDKKSAAADELNEWVIKIDAEYKALLNRHSLGDSILFIGTK